VAAVVAAHLARVRLALAEQLALGLVHHGARLHAHPDARAGGGPARPATRRRAARVAAALRLKERIDVELGAVRGGLPGRHNAPVAARLLGRHRRASRLLGDLHGRELLACRVGGPAAPADRALLHVQGKCSGTPGPSARCERA